MAKKKSSFSHIEAQQKLEQLRTSRETFGYDLLRIFCGYGEASIARIVDGRGNDARDGRTMLQKKLLAYCPQDCGGLFEGRDMYAELDDMRHDPKIAKKEPRLYVVSDGESVVAYDPKEDDIYENEIALLWKDFEFFKPLAGIEKFRNIEEQEADVRSAEVMAKIYDDIRRYNDVRDKGQMHNLNIFMSRLLFCYFAEDTGLFPEPNMFTNAIKSGTKADGSDLAEFIEGIFDIMAIGDADIRAQMPDIVSRFPYVNGGLFKAHIPIPVLSRRTRALMLKCGDYDWKDINPDIFGSMIQAVVLPEERSGLGIHYTSVPNIMKVIRPLFLDALTEEYIREKDNPKGLRALLTRLSCIKFFDPACGSGNFLIIIYKRVRELEIEIWQRLQTLAGGQSEMPFSNISLTQFYGIELDEYACDTATLSLWLAEHQMNNIFYEKLGSRPDALPLRPSGHIVCGNACRLDWNEVCPHTPDDEVYIMGNPPYLGARLQEISHKEDMQITMEGKVAFNNLDYIASWFFLSSTYIDGENIRAAFVTTNSLCQGEQVSLLWDYIYRHTDVEIYFGYKSFKWENNAKNNAGVTCTIIGLRQRNSLPKYLIDGQNNTGKKVRPTQRLFSRIS
ncbi:DNA methyltransferase [Alistipes sp.]|uniref:DNA methyltransferase n=1 Tax=Alistipes sp. TaxID=1872444 RepID=UPI003AEFB15B